MYEVRVLRASFRPQTFSVIIFNDWADILLGQSGKLCNVYSPRLSYDRLASAGDWVACSDKSSLFGTGGFFVKRCRLTDLSALPRLTNSERGTTAVDLVFWEANSGSRELEARGWTPLVLVKVGDLRLWEMLDCGRFLALDGALRWELRPRVCAGSIVFVPGTLLSNIFALGTRPLSFNKEGDGGSFVSICTSVGWPCIVWSGFRSVADISSCSTLATPGSRGIYCPVVTTWVNELDSLINCCVLRGCGLPLILLPCNTSYHSGNRSTTQLPSILILAG